MNEESIKANKALFCEEVAKRPANIRFSTYHLDIYLSDGRPFEGVNIYCFSRLMFRGGEKRVGVDTYKFNGPTLGLYHLTYDQRDGPVLNHFLNELDITIKYLSKSSAVININGSADTQHSYVDRRDYNKNLPNLWTFAIEFNYEFKC